MDPHPDFPTLTDGVVRLRPHHEGDLDGIVGQCSDPQTLRWTTVPRPYDEGQARRFLGVVREELARSDGARYWAIEPMDRQGGAPDFAGTIDLRPRGQGSAEVGFGLHPAARGRGLMSRALRLVCRWWWEQGGERVVWQAVAGNFPSWRVAWACGFTRHAELPQHLAHPDGLRDAWVASVGREDDLDRPVAPWCTVPVLESGAVRLRPWRDDDGPRCAPADVASHVLPPGAQPTPETFERWVLRRRDLGSQGRSMHWCIADADADDPLGDVCLIMEGRQPGCAELGYLLFPAARGQGAATAAGRLVVEHALATVDAGGLGLRRVTACTVGDNLRSARVLERIGFTEWGEEPDASARLDGSLDSVRHWALVRGRPAG